MSAKNGTSSPPAAQEARADYTRFSASRDYRSPDVPDWREHMRKASNHGLSELVSPVLASLLVFACCAGLLSATADSYAASVADEQRMIEQAHSEEEEGGVFEVAFCGKLVCTYTKDGWVATAANQDSPILVNRRKSDADASVTFTSSSGLVVGTIEAAPGEKVYTMDVLGLSDAGNYTLDVKAWAVSSAGSATGQTVSTRIVMRVK